MPETVQREKLFLDKNYRLCYILTAFGLQKYPRGRRGSPAKGVGV